MSRARHSAGASAGHIVFSHANGFPAGVYRVLFEAWRERGYVVHAIDKFGHDPAWPVSGNWPHLRDQLIAFVDAAVGGPAFLVGHSLGGLLSVLAASKRPDLARGVVLLDAPVIAGWRAHSLQVAKATGLIKRVSPGRVAQSRRPAWPSLAAVREHFAKKAAFARWDPRLLEDYVQCGFERRGSQTVLAFDRAVETRIYNTLPHQMGRVLRRHPLGCPVAFIGGQQSVELRQAGLEATHRLAGERFVWTAGTHLFPMEHPDATAAEVLRQLASMQGNGEGAPMSPI
jgi:pimeloyl-ACP methyl ester carboxylesterase